MSINKKKLWESFGSPQATNIITIATTVATIAVAIIFGVLQAVASKSATVQPGQPGQVAPSPLNGTAIALFVILIILTLANIFYLYRTRKSLSKYNIIRMLSGLQNKYILDSDFKKVKDHATNSKEQYLAVDGDARILTNSLSYDLVYCDGIADNIIKGAIYTYVIPNGFQVLNELESFISELYTKLYELVLPTKNNNIQHTIIEVKRLLSNNLWLWFFDKDTLCLYNFARFNQKGGTDPFLQSWWYVNPKDKPPNDDSLMLSYEIKDRTDQDQLNSVFSLLEHRSKKVDGETVHTNKDNLVSLYGG